MSATRLVTPAAVAAEPNVTPFIDVLLVLLVVFMLAQSVRTTLPVQTPAPPDGMTEGPTPQIVLELRADGSYAINQQPVPAGALVEQLRAIYARHPAKLLFVDAAPARTYQEVIAAMDLARGAGAQVVALMPRATLSR